MLVSFTKMHGPQIELPKVNSIWPMHNGKRTVYDPTSGRQPLLALAISVGCGFKSLWFCNVELQSFFLRIWSLMFIYGKNCAIENEEMLGTPLVLQNNMYRFQEIKDGVNILPCLIYNHFSLKHFLLLTRNQLSWPQAESAQMPCL